jgi:aconitate hydratase
MAPEYGATMGFFPVDAETSLPGHRPQRRADRRWSRPTKAQGLLARADAGRARLLRHVRLDLATVVPSLAGPKRPQDRVLLEGDAGNFADNRPRPSLQQSAVKDRGFNQARQLAAGPRHGSGATSSTNSTDGSVVIAAITSCTNTSNPGVMLGAGLLAQEGGRAA